MKKLFIGLVIALFVFAGSVAAETHVFAGGGANFDLFSEGSTYELETSPGVSLGFTRSLSERCNYP